MEKMLHRGHIQKIKEVKKSSKFKNPKVKGVLSVILQTEWFRTTDSLIYSRVAETYDQKLESSFDNIMIKIIVPFTKKLSSDRWVVLFPNSTLELGVAPTELTIEHDNEELEVKWCERRQDYLRSASPEVGGRILFFPPGEVLLVSIIEQPHSKGIRIDTTRKRPLRPAAQKQESLGGQERSLEGVEALNAYP